MTKFTFLLAYLAISALLVTAAVVAEAADAMAAASVTVGSTTIAAFFAGFIGEWRRKKKLEWRHLMRTSSYMAVACGTLALVSWSIWPQQSARIVGVLGFCSLAGGPQAVDLVWNRARHDYLDVKNKDVGK